MANNVSIKKLLVKACILFSVALPNLSAFASGGDGYGESDFTPENHVTTADIADFASGKIGVVPNSYWRVYQFLAYRAVDRKSVV